MIYNENECGTKTKAAIPSTGYDRRKTTVGYGIF
jgi:hypothetical protein